VKTQIKDLLQIVNAHQATEMLKTILLVKNSQKYLKLKT
jgi:hypothetical protein